MDALFDNQTDNLSFPVFWDTYALKRDRIAAERAWKKLSLKDKKAAVDGIEAYRKDCLRRGIHMMYAQGYLNHRRWEDEREPDSNQLSTTNNPFNNNNGKPLSYTTAIMAEQRKAEVRELSRIATAGAAALTSLGDSQAEA